MLLLLFVVVDVVVVKKKGEGVLFNVGGHTGKDCLLTRSDDVKVADRQDRTRNLSLRKRCTNHCTTGRGGAGVVNFGRQ